MQSIITKYIGPGASRGARVKATSASGKSLTVPYTYESEDGDHDRAATALASKLGWSGTLVRGGTKDGYVYVFANDHRVEIRAANAAGGRRRATAHRAGGKRTARRNLCGC